MPLLDVRPDHLEWVKKILAEQVPQADVWAFGSRAKWLAKDTSDLDLCVDAKQALSFVQIGLLKEAFEDSDLPYKVDVVDWATTSESFRKIIARDRVVVQRAASGESWRVSSECSLLDEVAEVVDSLHKTPSYADKGIPMVRVTDVKYGSLNLSSTLLVDETTYLEFSRRYKPAIDDIVITRVGTYGVTARVIETKFCLGQNTAAIIPKSINSRYLYAALNSEFVRAQIEAGVVGSTQKTLSLKHIKALSIPRLGSIEEAEIAEIVGALDDRITLLRETNATLEAIAQALFKSWFVDFDPVRAKLEGRAPEGMDAATARLFPDNFEESALGLVPRGWQVGTLGEHTSYLSRGISPKYVEDGGVIVINQKCIRDFSLDLSKARRHDPVQRKIDGRELLKGDILVNSTGVGTLGRVAQVLSLNNPVIVDSHVTVMRADSSLTWNYLGLLIMRRQSEIEGMGEGSTGQTELSRGKLAVLKLIAPSTAVLQEFDEVVLPLRERFSANQMQAQTLATLRDTLLPRLISGQLRLRDAKNQPEAIPS